MRGIIVALPSDLEDTRSDLEDEKKSCMLVLIDVQRMTTTVTSIFACTEAKQVLLFPSVEDVHAAKQHPTDICAGERNCVKIHGFDLDNSPWSVISAEKRRFVGARVLVSTSNGSRAFASALKLTNSIVLGSLVNLSAVVNNILRSKPEQVVFLCSGTCGERSEEDELCAGLLANKLQALVKDFEYDAFSASIMEKCRDLDIFSLQERVCSSKNAEMLRSAGLERDLEYCCKVDKHCRILPKFDAKIGAFLLVRCSGRRGGVSRFAELEKPVVVEEATAVADVQAEVLLLPEYQCHLDPLLSEKLKSVFGAEWLEAFRTALKSAPPTTCLRVNLSRVRCMEAAVQLLKDILGDSAEVAAHPVLCDAVLLSPSKKTLDPGDLPIKSIFIDVVAGGTVLRGSDVYAVGVLSASKSISVGDSVRVCVVLSKTTRGRAISEWPGKRIVIGRGVALMDRVTMFRASRGTAIKMGARFGVELPSLQALPTDLFFAQNLPSLLCSHVLQPEPGDAVLDMCAAPGGKMGHLQSMVGCDGIVVGYDRSGTKVKKTQALCDGWCEGAVMLKGDAGKSVDFEALTPYCGAVSRAEIVREVTSRFLDGRDLKEHPCCSVNKSMLRFAPAVFDSVLLDGPCSSIGQRPRFVVRTTALELGELWKQQRRLLEAGVRALKPGGRLVYSTCTVLVEECEENVRWALDSLPLRLVAPPIEMGECGLEGVLSEEERKMVRRFSPTGSTIGFFFALFVKYEE